MDEDEDAQTEQQLVLQEKARKEEELKVLEELLAEGYESPVHPRFTLARTPPSSFGPSPSSSLAPGDGGSQSAKRNLTSPEEVQDAVRRRVEALPSAPAVHSGPHPPIELWSVAISVPCAW
ncbi:hypothetical protein MSG28_015345 [Choristoneura fumiferana]|uniref:Uncharacterized protein n=1 Tax=Choristoneura fumiferana TaxID=7141 RepID=A0ACC0KB71_CHOFU|nr:hypothetical protein MSG28_015345 [Choristoneura fumiferana]